MSEYIVLRVRDDEQERRRCRATEKRRQQYEREMMQRKEALQLARFEQMMQKSQLDIVEQQHAGNHEIS